MRARFAPAVLAVGLTLGLLAACDPVAGDRAAASTSKAPAGAAFWEGPESLESHAPGDLIWARDYTGPMELAGASNHLVLYAQTGIRGDLVATSGVVSVPEGTAPAGGWPVVTWAHGTTGIADECAPSRLEGEPGSNPLNPILVQPWIDAGYAVVQTDYEGLGTPGDHPYLMGPSEGRAVLDIVHAARDLDPDVGTDVVIAGHSQGGHAALWAAAMADRAASDLDVHGVVALAPASNLALVLDVVLAGKVEAPVGMIAMVLRGLEIGYPDDIEPEDLLRPAGLEQYPRTLDLCLGDLFSPEVYGAMPVEDFGNTDADLDLVKRKLNANDPSFPEIRVPVLVAQGGKDVIVPQILSDFLTEAYEKRDFDLDYLTYPKADHISVLTASADAVHAFIADALTP